MKFTVKLLTVLLTIGGISGAYGNDNGPGPEPSTSISALFDRLRQERRDLVLTNSAAAPAHLESLFVKLRTNHRDNETDNPANIPATYRHIEIFPPELRTKDSGTGPATVEIFPSELRLDYRDFDEESIQIFPSDLRPDYRDVEPDEGETISGLADGLPEKAKVIEPETASATTDRKPSRPAKARSIKSTVMVTRFSFNTDGSSYGSLSGSHQGRTASGIGNGGEILGYTIPLDSSLKKIKTKNGRPVARLRQAAILTFTSGDQTVRLLAVGNDTGGRHINGNSRNRDWGELGVNTWLEAKRRGLGIQITRNSLKIPRDTTLEYAFLEETVSSVAQYRQLEAKLSKQGLID